jgi:glycosyltransferase involved in cell wall biosynthesis
MSESIRWSAIPLSWSKAHPLGKRMRAALGRARRYLRRPSRRRRHAAERSGNPIGYIATTRAAGSRELFSSMHPITGDQLLSTRRSDADAQGHSEQTSLGYLLAEAPVTGTLALAHHFAPSGTEPGDAVAIPRGQLIRPQPSGEHPVPRDALRVLGFAVLANEPVARVEVLLAGRNVGRARLGIQRPPKFSVPDAPEAPICGFDLRIPPSAVPPGAREVSVEVVVTGVDGTDFVLAPDHPVRLDPPITDGGESRPSTNGSVSALPRKRNTDGKRLVAFAHNLSPGGAQRTLFEQLVRLSSREFSSVVVSPRPGPWESLLKEAGIPVHITDPYPVTDSAQYERQKASLREWMGEQGFDAVFANTLGCFMGVDLARELGLPSLWMIHESYELPVWWNMVQGGEPVPELRQLCIQALGSTDALMFPAAATRTLFEPYAHTEEMVVAPCGVEFEEIDRYRSAVDVAQLRRDNDLAPDAEVLLCLGIVEPRKGQAVLARAFSLIAERHPQAHLVFVGGTDSRYARGLQRYIDQAGLSQRCRVVPATMEPFRWHALADVFVLPSDIESAPVVLAEAMAFETPAVAANVFGIPEMVTDGRDGFLCEPNDVADLAATLDRVLSLGPEERRRVAVAGSQRAREHHNPSHFQRNFEAVLGRLLDGQALEPVLAEEG